jgi:hypothetical protein
MFKRAKKFILKKVCLGLIVTGILLFQPGGISAALEAAAALPLLTSEQIAYLRMENLAQVEGIPVLPLYSIEQEIAYPNLHGSKPANPRNPPKVGIQIGHLQSSELPGELASLRGSQGASGGGYTEIAIAQDIATQVQTLLTQQIPGIQVDLLPATVPINYSADLFLALHCDWSNRPEVNGFKFARSRYSAIPALDDELLKVLYSNFEANTGRPREAGITINMTGYYAFNNLRFQHSLSPTTPGAIMEMGFLTNLTDRNFLVNQRNKVASAITTGIIAFLKEQKQKEPVVPFEHLSALVVKAPEDDLVPVYENGGNKIIAYLNSGQYFAYFESQDDYFTIWLPVLNRLGQVKRANASVTGN